MESYRTEEEQVEALKRWWNENGRSLVVGVVLALGLSFGWQAWQKNRQVEAENASVLYQELLRSLSAESGDDADISIALASDIKERHGGAVYAQFAGLHLARLAVNEERLDDAESELRWVLSKADAGGDVQAVAQLRLARVLAAAGDTEQALTLLDAGGAGYEASYAMARGDVLLSAGRDEEALTAYREAASQLDPSMPVPGTLQEKLQHLAGDQNLPLAGAQ